jgi:hypothetical protein
MLIVVDFAQFRKSGEARTAVIFGLAGGDDAHAGRNDRDRRLDKSGGIQILDCIGISLAQIVNATRSFRQCLCSWVICDEIAPTVLGLDR